MKTNSEPDYTPAVFTKDNPCTKVEIWNAFFSEGKFRATPVVVARTIIGINTPKYLLREGFIFEQLIGGVDYYCVTEDGASWMRNGILRYLELHPERRGDCNELPDSVAPARVSVAVPQRTRRTPPPAPVAPPATSRIVRRTRT